MLLLAEERLDVPIKIFTATHWQSAEFSEMIENGVVVPSKEWMEHDGTVLKLGQAACCYSHIKLLEDVAKNEYKTILLLQDDVYWEHPGELEHELEKYAELIQRYNDFDLYYVGRSIVEPTAEDAFHDTNFKRPSYSWNAHALILSLTCCQKLIAADVLSNVIPFDEFLPLCYGQSGCVRADMLSSRFPKIISAVSSDEHETIYQCTHASSRFRDMVMPYSLSDIDNSELCD